MLLQASLKSCEWDLVKEIIRFLSAIGNFFSFKFFLYLWDILLNENWIQNRSSWFWERAVWNIKQCRVQWSNQYECRHQHHHRKVSTTHSASSTVRRGQTKAKTCQKTFIFVIRLRNHRAVHTEHGVRARVLLAQKQSTQAVVRHVCQSQWIQYAKVAHAIRVSPVFFFFLYKIWI